MRSCKRMIFCLKLLALVGFLTSCATYNTVRELRLVGFEENVKKGKSLGQVEGGDCIYHVFGYWLGGQPTISRAFSNAQKQYTSTIADSGGGKSGAGSVRYMNNVTVKNDGFNAVLFGKSCIMVSGMGYK